ncbi:MAG: Smr/MutS family protein [Bacteroidales bacterium]|nr:Smr/MutS family protein [Bacteroidales bacterium]
MTKEQEIGFDFVKKAIKNLCKTSYAKERAEELVFLENYEEINRLLSETSEMKSLLLGVRDFPSDGYCDMIDALNSLRVEGMFISLPQMKDFLLSYSAIRNILLFFRSANEVDIPFLKRTYENVLFFEEILKECMLIIDEDGEIKDSYSPVLREIRQKRQAKAKDINRRMQNILSLSKNNGWTNTDDELTIRNNTLVIPVKSSFKRQIKGILHDTSQTGQTFYVEPEEIVGINFEIKELYFQEQQEIRNILLSFSNLLREHLDEIIFSYEFLSQIDFIRAKALYSINIHAGKPELKSDPCLDWFEARHPILEESLKKKQRKIVPLRIKLDNEKRILVISGPNAGGKSVCLKTVALLQYMLQCGLLIPLKEVSVAGIFHDIFISIGDSQSIENDLSTYSSHLLQMKSLCETADCGTMFLIDECGAGTDPQIGGAIAESILEYLTEVNSWGIVTTHYSNLKHLAFSNQHIQNAAMLYDKENMQPLYALSIGTPGSSFAFEIAERIGLSGAIIKKAKEKAGSSTIRFEQELQQIEVEKLSLQEERSRMKEYDEMLYETFQKYKSMEEKLSSERKAILNQARAEAKEIIQNANKRIERAIEEIKTSKADSKKVKQIKQELKQKVEVLQQDIDKQKSETEKEIVLSEKRSHLKLVNTPLSAGDYVIFGEETEPMEVKSVNKNRVELINGLMSIRTTVDKVHKIEKQSYLKQLKHKNTERFSSNPIMDKINTIRAGFSPKIDLRGERTEEALKKISKLLDTARLLGEGQIKILHGKGDGILKVMIRDYLKTLPEVKTFYPEKVEFGGEGITIVELN